MILNRIQPEVDPYSRPIQNSFSLERSTTAHILALGRLIKRVKEKNLKATLVLIDFKKAFDSINRGKMLKTLRAYGILELVVTVIGRLHTGRNAYYLMGKQSSLKY